MHRRIIGLLALFAFMASAGSARAAFDPFSEWDRLMKWKKPENYPPPIIEGMKVDTLSRLLESGNLQWYQPRPEPDKWEGVVAMKIHAPPELIWEIITDYEDQCRILPKTFLECKTEYRKGNEVKNVYRIQTTVLRFSYKFPMIDLVKEDPPYHLHINTLEGGLKGRELDLLLIPVENDNSTLFFMRYYAGMASLGYSMQLVLKVMPMVEPPTAVGAANYHSRAYKNEAEKRAGYCPPKKPKPVDFSKVDLDTLRKIIAQNGGMIRETPDGEIIEGVAFAFINARPETVWEVATDFERYEQIFPGSKFEIEKKEGNTLLARQRTSSFSVLIFNFGYDLHSLYTLDPPYRLSYYSIDGIYEGSHGSLEIVPIEGGAKTLLVGTAKINLEKDKGLTARIARSGAFPLENMLNILGVQSTLAHIREEAEKRDGSAASLSPGE